MPPMWSRTPNSSPSPLFGLPMSSAGGGAGEPSTLALNHQEETMLYSTDRILTTHAGSLPRPPDLREMVLAKANGEPYDPTELDERLKSAVAEAVRRQVESGIDCVNDGELSKT